jgi:hypothetical protein
MQAHLGYMCKLTPLSFKCRRTWGLDKNTVMLLFDPSSPNILNPVYIGDAAYAKLRRPFWQELQSRYGNMFYIREEVKPLVFVAVCYYAVV